MYFLIRMIYMNTCDLYLILLVSHFVFLVCHVLYILSVARTFANFCVPWRLL